MSPCVMASGTSGNVTTKPPAFLSGVNFAGYSPSQTVNAVNSLRGACLIQGIVVAMMCRKAVTRIPVTESRPKALLWLVDKASSKRPPVDVKIGDLGEYVVGSRVKEATEDERDAVLGAVAAFVMESRRTQAAPGQEGCAGPARGLKNYLPDLRF
jgi:hypothetical protein